MIAFRRLPPVRGTGATAFRRWGLTKRRQIMSGRVPDQSSIYCFVLMPIDIPGGGDSRPIDFRMPVEQGIGEAPRRFRNNLPRANYRVNRLSGRANGMNRVVQKVGPP